MKLVSPGSAQPTSSHTVRPRRRLDRGSIAIIAAVGMAAILGMAAVVIDGGYMSMRRRHMQAVADAAALAGGLSLPTSATAIAQARAMATKNGLTDGVAGVTVTVNSPYLADTKKIEVIIQTNASTFLGKALRINTGLVKGRAVVTSTPASSSVFAGSTACAGNACGRTLCVQGQGYTIPGSLHSNGSLQVGGDGSDTVSGAIEYESGCAGDIFGTLNAAGTQTATTAPNQPYPLSWTLASFTSACTIPTPGAFFVGDVDLASNPAWWQSGNAAAGGVLKANTVCATGRIQLNGSNITGSSITFVAGSDIQMSGNNFNFTARTNNVVAYSNSASANAINMGTASWTWTGDVFAPNGTIMINGQNFNTSGMIVGSNVFLGSTTWTFTGGGGGGGAPYISE